MREATLADTATVCSWMDEGTANPDVIRNLWLSDPMNVVLIEGGGGAIFTWRGPGIYEVHVAFTQRGREVIELSHRMLTLMREVYGARIFWAAVPWNGSKQSRKVRLFTRLMGWKSRGRANLATGLHELFISD